MAIVAAALLLRLFLSCFLSRIERSKELCGNVIVVVVVDDVACRLQMRARRT